MKSFFCKFSPISRYLQISTVPCIVFGNRGPWKEFVEKLFWAKLVHNFIGHSVPIVTDNIFYIQPGTRPIIFNPCVFNYGASLQINALLVKLLLF